MTQSELRELKAIGAELGAAKAENEKLRGLLRELRDITSEYAWDDDLEARVDAALPQQSEHPDTYTAVDMARAAAQGLRDGQAAVEQDTAQDETLADRMRAAGMLTIDEMLSGAPLDRFIRHAGVNDLETYGQWLDMTCREFLTMQATRDLDKRDDDDLYEWVLAHAAAFQEARINFKAARPAQTEQQPSTTQQVLDLILEECRYWQGRDEVRRGGFACLYAKAKEIADNAAPIAQTAPQPEQINIDPLLNAGAALSNIAFNLAQRPGVTLDQHVCDLLSSARKRWDAARAALSAQGAGDADS